MDDADAYKVSAIIVSIAVVSMSIIIIVSLSMLIEVESIEASSEGLLVQEANAIMPATNANASTFFIFCSVNKVLMGQMYYLKTIRKIICLVFFLELRISLENDE